MENGRERDATSMQRVWKNRGYVKYDETTRKYTKSEANSSNR